MMGQTELAVSIIMPVYNSEKYLKACVDSILRQEFDSYELLLIDDGSTDGSPAICDSYAAENHHVKVFHKANGGICEARNFGLERAHGEYIAFSDHDDIVLTGFLSENYQIAIENHADIVKFGRKGLLLRDEKELSSDVRKFDDRVIEHRQIVDEFLFMRVRGMMNCVWDGFFRRDFLNENDISFDTKYKKGGEDIDFCSRCFIAAEKAVLRSKVYYEHYIRMGISTSTVEDPNRLQKFQNLGDNLDQCIQDGKIDKNAHLAEYTVCVARDEAYPTIKYLLGVKKSDAEIRAKLQEIYGQRKVQKVSLNNLRLVSSKWGIFSWLFASRKYGLVIAFVRVNMMRKKAGGLS